MALLAACVGTDPAPTFSDTPDASLPDAGGSPLDAGSFACSDAPSFEASLIDALPSPPAAARGVISVPSPGGHLVLVPADLSDGGAALGERTGALWLDGVLAGTTGFRMTLEYSVFVVRGNAEGFAIAWAAGRVPPSGRDFGVCGSGVPGFALVVPSDTATPDLVSHASAGCSSRAPGTPWIGSKLLAGVLTPSPWYALDMTVSPTRVTYAVAELGFWDDVRPTGARWQGSFERGGYGAERIAHVGLSARTGGTYGNTAQRVRNLKLYPCTGR